MDPEQERVPESAERRQFRERAALLGLSTVHISSPQEPNSVRLFVGGDSVRLRGDATVTVRIGATRGVVKGFTKASRQRMLRFLQTLDQARAGVPLFVTLTYPGRWPGSARRWKRDLEVWLGRLKRAKPEVWAVWRLEPQRRGAPHYHLLVFGVPLLEKEWLSRSWFEVVGSQDERHLRAGTQVQRVKSWRGVVWYAAKYLAKDIGLLPEEWRGGVGRWWGVHQRRRAPREAMEVPVGSRAFVRLRRVLRRLVRGPGQSGRDWWPDRVLFPKRFLKKGLCARLSAPAAAKLLTWAGVDASEESTRRMRPSS